MNSKKTFTTDRLEKIMASALNKRSINNSHALNFAKYPAYKLNAQKASAPFKKYLPYSLNYKNFEKAVLFIALTLLFSAVRTPDAFATASLRRANPMAALASMQERMQQTEAGAGAEVCTDCASRSPQSSLTNYLSQLPVVRDGFARVQNVAIFDQDRRQAIMDLRSRNPQTLTAEERAILRASAQTGLVTCQSGSTNGTLIRLEDGRDAVITTAHAFLDSNGHPKCDLRQIRYMPNVSFHTGGTPDDFVIHTVNTNGELPLNIEQAANHRQVKNDFLIFVLSDNISQDPMPDGSTRGFMKIASQLPERGTSYLIGRNNNFRDGATSYDSCPYQNIGTNLFHLCATTNTSSSSAITQLVDGEMILTGIHSRAYTDYNESIVPTPSNMIDGNVGLSIDTVRQYLSDQARPPVLSYGLSI